MKLPEPFPLCVITISSGGFPILCWHTLSPYYPFIHSPSTHYSCCRYLVRVNLEACQWVHDGTETTALLDYEYVYNEHDTHHVVKWNLNDLFEPLYHWIPKLSARKTYGILTGRLDDSFTVGRPKNSRYSARPIIRPNSELSGRYTCLVSSMAGNDYRHGYMVLYDEGTQCLRLEEAPSLISLCLNLLTSLR